MFYTFYEKKRGKWKTLSTGGTIDGGSDASGSSSAIITYGDGTVTKINKTTGASLASAKLLDEEGNEVTFSDERSYYLLKIDKSFLDYEEEMQEKDEILIRDVVELGKHLQNLCRTDRRQGPSAEVPGAQG